MASIPERITLMESKILELGKAQQDKGYRGGVLTPGLIRKETEYSYRAINTVLESLIEKGLVEKMITSAIRKGSVVELDVYKITFDGMECLEKVSAGQVKVTGSEPPASRLSKAEPRRFSKPWDDDRPQKSWDKPAPDPDVAYSIKSLEEAIRVINSEVKALNRKLDEAIAARPVTPAPPPPEPRKARPADTPMLRHRLLILESVRELAAKNDFVLADDLKQLYADRCSENDLKPKGMSQFTPFLKRLEGEGIIALKRMGCKNLGIKGQGSRVVIKMTPQGEAMLSG